MKREMMRLEAVGAGLLAAVLVFAAGAVQAQDWVTPSTCKSGVSGNENDEPPVVEFYEGKSPGSLTLRDTINRVYFDKGVGYVEVTIADPFDSFFITVSYTPYLGGYVAPSIWNYNLQQTFQLPAAGYDNSPQYKTYPSVTFTINSQKTGKAMPYANIMVTPDYPGSSPYALQTDGSGQFTVYCFQQFPSENNVFVVSQDGSESFETNLTVNTNDLVAARHGHRRRPAAVVGVVHENNPPEDKSR